MEKTIQEKFDILLSMEQEVQVIRNNQSTTLKEIRRQLKEGVSSGNSITDFLLACGGVPYCEQARKAGEKFRTFAEECMATLKPNELILVIRTKVVVAKTPSGERTSCDAVNKYFAAVLSSGTELTYNPANRSLDFPFATEYIGDLADTGSWCNVGVPTDLTPGEFFFLDKLSRFASGITPAGDHEVWDAYIGNRAVEEYVELARGIARDSDRKALLDVLLRVSGKDYSALKKRS